MAAHKQGVGFTSEEKDLCISLFNGRLRFEGDGPIYSGFVYRIEPEDGYVPLPPLNPNFSECGIWFVIFPLRFPCLHPVVSHLLRQVQTLTFCTA